MTKSIFQEITNAQIAIENTLANKSILQKLALFGYDIKKIKDGKVKCETAMLLQSVQKKEYGTQYKATDALYRAKEEADEVFSRHLSIARLVFKNNRDAWNTLQLAGFSKRNLSIWSEKARIFYTNAPDMIAQLELYGITLAELESGKAMVEAVTTAYARRKQDKGNAQQSTRHRNKALADLKIWMSDFLAIARIALKNDEAHQEAMGIVIR